MKLYVKATSSYRSDREDIDIKKELKQKYSQDTRRKDEFINLAILGAQRLKRRVHVDEKDELYITSGVGNIDILLKTNNYVLKNGDSVRPVDFINMLGNTTSYYVATSLHVKGKNIFQISDNFTFINTLISIYASINSSKKDAILGCVDLVSNPSEVIKRLLHVDESCEIVSGSNYQKLSLNSKNAAASLEFDVKTYTLEDIKKLEQSSTCKVLYLNRKDVFFETIISSEINDAIESLEDVLFIEHSSNKYKILKVEVFK
ncbi:MAG: hypothetical protein U9N42_02335 [Campylobacterota bacterium]|nr:hypothetical protein [Campylobacterota bacterium]